jgi:phage virion morphogenesis protein
MSGIELTVDLKAFERVSKRLQSLADFDREKLLDEIGALGVDQTKSRISSEKTAPDGTKWKPNRRGGSILRLTDNLLTSIHHEASATQTQWGSNLPYAAIHQTGGKIKPKNKKFLRFMAGNKAIFVREVNMPARPYLGISPENADDIEDLIANYIAERLQ